MKKILFIFILFFITSWYVNASTCSNYNDRYNKEYSNYLNSSYKDSSRWTYYNLYLEYKDKYNNCYENYKKAFDNWYNSYEVWDYLSAIKYFKEAWYLNWMDWNTKTNLGLSYFYLAWWYFNKKEFKNAIKYYKEAEYIWYNDIYSIYVNIWASYSNLEDTKNALIFFRKAKNITFNLEEIKNIDERIRIAESIIKEKKEKKNAFTNDTYSYKQYYIKQLNIRKAQKSFSKNKQVIIAIIDDWININHPDLSNNIWVNKKEIPWNWIDDDRNGYIDDYSWVNFVQNDLWYITNIIPAWSHWTEVAWIIWASINNGEGIMWIAKNVKLMNLRAFPLNWNWANDKDILNAIKYAINNWANIINLSLWTSNNLIAKNNNDYNKIFSEAYNKWVIIVIAGWNWDILSKQTEWVNTTVNPVYPVCSENYYKNIIWVWALTDNWLRVRWSNYGKCIDLYAPWVNIMTTFLDSSNSSSYSYNSVSWTSFSAPIISWIIWLWYNKYWKVTSDIVYDAMQNSVIINKNWDYIIDSNKYLIELWGLIQKKKEEIENEHLEKLIDIFFNKMKLKNKRYSEEKRKSIYEWLLKTLEEKKKTISNKKRLFVFNYFIYLLNKELWNNINKCDEVSQLLWLCK